MITVSAPGKLMLMGEHAVVYGFPSLVTAVDERLTVETEIVAEDRIAVDAPQGVDTRFVDEAVRQAQKAWSIPSGGFRIKTQSNFSGKYGFGSSASVTVATLKALALLFKKDVAPRELFDLSFATVLVVQGVGSGFDVAVSVYGGTLYYTLGQKITELTQARYRESSDQTISELPLIVGYTGVKADTTTLIKQVAEKKEKNPEKVERIFQAITKLVEEAKKRMLEGDWERVGKLMEFNQEYLRDLGVSSEKLEALISAAKKAGAWGAKLSGAGGGDCMIALGPSDKRAAIQKAIADAGGEAIDVHPNAQGVRIETL
ncbi:MAG: mevalonate kinase [Patescibacteria group bacterium]